MSELTTDNPANPDFKDPFAEYPDSIRSALWGKGNLESFKRGARILEPGETPHDVSFLVSGKAQVLVREPNNPDILVDILSAGELIGEISFLTGLPNPNNSEVIADEDSTVLKIPAIEFENVLKSNPEFTINVLKRLARKVIRLDQNVYKNTRRKRALQNIISREDHLFPDYFVGETVRKRVSRRLEELAGSQEPVLITGETGVGKEFLAHAMYTMSSSHQRVFLFLDLLRPLTETKNNLNYCELPEENLDLTEQQMKLFFGSETREQGQSRVETPGYLELTEEGTLLVRGMEHLTPLMQNRLLFSLKNGKFKKVGALGYQNLDTRIIGTTNLDASEISAEKHPLLHWMLEHSIHVPPLRKRRKEIPALVEHYVGKYSQELHKEINKLPKETIKTLVGYSWPGNDRELATTLKRAVLLSADGVIRPQDIYFDLRRIEADGKINLLRAPTIKGAISSPLFPVIFQSAATPFFFILLVLLFLGPASPSSNVGALFSWAIGWPTMIFGAFIWARFWCSLCPMGAIGHLAKKLISFDIPFPAFLKQNSDLIIAVSAMFIIWLEIATDLRSSPFNTGLLLITILLFAVIFSIVFERQSWCRYLCPLGGMMGVLAKVSPFELRADRNVCASQCTSNECFVGTSSHEGCPFGQMAPSLRSNRFCKLCGNCVKNCPHGAINLNLRIPGREIWEMRQVGAITSFLVISMYGGLISELLETGSLYDWFYRIFMDWPDIVVFTGFFTVCIFCANSLVFLAANLSSRVTGESSRENFARFGLALLPLVLTGFMAFHLYYLINLGVYFPIVLWQTFHFSVFERMVITVPPSWTLFIQQVLILIGSLGTMVITYRLGRGKESHFSSHLIEIIPHMAVAVILTITLLYAIESFFY
ncbi:MAG: sigma 54-interacting transcriptional regulator [Desulfomonilaceae bacterium]|jgi:DNA-binding NtrC family response regulator/ferredoxin